MKHWNYLKYVLRHKWYVFVCGRMCGVGFWQLIVHDFSKFFPSEWSPYVNSFYGGWKYKERPDWLVASFDKAWLHHIHHNPHHWQHWLLQNDEDGFKILPMPDKYVREMAADWCSANRTITGGWNIWDWYEKNKGKIMLDKSSRESVEFYLNQVVTR